MINLDYVINYTFHHVISNGLQSGSNLPSFDGDKPRLPLGRLGTEHLLFVSCSLPSSSGTSDCYSHSLSSTPPAWTTSTWKKKTYLNQSEFNVKHTSYENISVCVNSLWAEIKRCAVQKCVNMFETHSLMSRSCSKSCGLVRSGSWARRWIMYGTTYSGRRDSSFSENQTHRIFRSWPFKQFRSSSVWHVWYQKRYLPWAMGFCLMYSLRTLMFLSRHCRAWARRSFTGSLAHNANTAMYSSGNNSFTRARCNFWAKIWRTW